MAAKGMTMGFFSRLFKIKEQDPTSPDTTWAMEDNGSELVLDPEYAATLMTEIDIDADGCNDDDPEDKDIDADFAANSLREICPA